MISECTSYTEAVDLLQSTFIKQKNEIFARHKLCTCKQEPGQTIDQFLLQLKTLSKDCNYVNVSAAECCNLAVRD